LGAGVGGSGHDGCIRVSGGGIRTMLVMGGTAAVVTATATPLSVVVVGWGGFVSGDLISAGGVVGGQSAGVGGGWGSVVGIRLDICCQR
jgi:hypothetical protein